MFKTKMNFLSLFSLFQLLIFAPLSGNWSPAVDLSTYSTNDSFETAMKVAMSANGDSVVIWPFKDTPTPTHYTIQAASKTLTALWPVPPAPDTVYTASRDSLNPDVAMDASGNALAVWATNIGLGNTEILGSTKSPTGSWSLPFSISDSTPSNNSVPHVAMDANGNATVIWIKNTGGINEVHARTRSSAGVLDPPLSSSSLISALGDDSAGLHVAMASASGTATVIWRDVATNMIMAKTKTLTGSWPVSGTTLSLAFSNNPRLAMDALGNTTVVWIDNLTTDVFAVTKSASSLSWSTPPIDISSAAAASPEVAMSANGATTVAWNSSGTIEAATKAASSSLWSAPQPISATGSFNPNVVMDSAGNTAVVFVTPMSGTNYIEVVTKAAGGSWSSPFQLHQGINQDDIRNIGIDAYGNVTVAWLFDGSSGLTPPFTNDRVQASQGTLLFPPYPPSGLAGSQSYNRFLTQIEFVINLSWEASPSPFLDSYLIYRDGALIAKVPATSPLVFADHNRKSYTCYDYSVKAMDTAGNISTADTKTICTTGI